MAFIHGANAVVLVGDYNLSPYFNRLSWKRSKALAETPGFGATAMTRVASKIKDGSITATGLFDASASAVDARLAATFDAAAGAVISVCPQVTTIGNAGYICQPRMAGYGVDSPVSGAVATDATWQGDGGIHRAIFLHALGAETGTMNGASVNNGASSDNGGFATIHVTAATVVSVTVKIQHAPDDATWADLVSFTAVTGITSQLATVALTTTVDQYLRCIISAWNGTTMTFAAAFARNPDQAA